MRLIKGLIVLVVIIGALVWFGAPALLETGWAKDRVQKALQTGTGRTAEVGSLSFSWASGLVVKDVVLHQKEGQPSEAGPLFKLGKLELDIGFKDLLDKKINVEELTIDEPRLVLIRDAAGRFNFADLLEGGRQSAGSQGEAQADIKAALEIEDGSLLFIDQALGTKVEASDLDASAIWNAGRLSVKLTMTLNGGDVRMVGSADLSQTPSPFEVAEFVIDGTKLNSQFANLGLFVPLMGDKPQAVSGTLDFKLKDLRGRGFDRASFRSNLTGSGDLAVGAGTVVSGPIIQILNVFKTLGAGDLSALSHGVSGEGIAFQKLASDFTIGGGRVTSQRIALEGTGIDLTLAGSTTFDGALAYDIHAQSLDDLIAENAALAKLLGGKKVIPLKLTGTLASPSVTPDLAGTIQGAVEGALQKAAADQLGKLLGGK